VNLVEFLAEAHEHGPCVGLHTATSTAATPPTGVELRIIDGAQTKTLDGLYDAFAEAWHFPPWFGRNAAAFDDFMRDLDNMINTESGKPPASGYLTQITSAHLILADQPEAFPWFANCMPFYRDYYRDEATPTATFGLLLSVPAECLDEVRGRWLTVNVPIAAVTI
jgi:Barstar (barnase inhibitor)